MACEASSYAACLSDPGMHQSAIGSSGMWLATGLKLANCVTHADRTGERGERFTQISRTNVSVRGGATSMTVTVRPSAGGDVYVVTVTGRSLESQRCTAFQSRS